MKSWPWRAQSSVLLTEGKRQVRVSYNVLLPALFSLVFSVPRLVNGFK